MRRSPRKALALHRETLLRLEPSAQALREVAGLRSVVTNSDGDICTGELRCITTSGFICGPIPMIVEPEPTF